MKVEENQELLEIQQKLRVLMFWPNALLNNILTGNVYSFYLAIFKLIVTNNGFEPIP